MKSKRGSKLNDYLSDSDDKKRGISFRADNACEMHGSEIDNSEVIIAEVKKSLSSNSKRSLIKLLIGILLVASVIMLFGGILKYNELEAERKRLEYELADLEAEIDELQYLIDSPVDYDYIVRIAREKLNLYLPDEIVYYSDINE